MLVHYATIPAECVSQQCDNGVDALGDQTGSDLPDRMDALTIEDSTRIRRAELWRNSLRMASAVFGQGQEEVASSSLSIRDGSGAGHKGRRGIKRWRDDVDGHAYNDAPMSKRRRLEVLWLQVGGASVAVGYDKVGPLIAVKTGNVKAKFRMVPIQAPGSHQSPLNRCVKVSTGRQTCDLRTMLKRSQLQAPDSNRQRKVMLPQDRYMREVPVSNASTYRSKIKSPVLAPSVKTSLRQSVPSHRQDLRKRLSWGGRPETQMTEKPQRKMKLDMVAVSRMIKFHTSQRRKT